MVLGTPWLKTALPNCLLSPPLPLLSIAKRSSRSLSSESGAFARRRGAQGSLSKNRQLRRSPLPPSIARGNECSHGSYLLREGRGSDQWGMGRPEFDGFTILAQMAHQGAPPFVPTLSLCSYLLREG